MPKEARFSPHSSPEGHPDPKNPDPYLVEHKPFLMVSKLWNWKDGKWDRIGQGKLQLLFEPLLVQGVPPLFSQLNPQHWSIDQLTWRNVPSDIPGSAGNAVLAMLNSSMAEVTKVGFSDTMEWWNLVVATEGTVLREGGRPKAMAYIPVELVIAIITTSYPKKRSQEDVKRL